MKQTLRRLSRRLTPTARAEVQYGGGPLTRDILARCETLGGAYRPTPWAINRHVQIGLYLANERREAPLNWEVDERLRADDGGTVSIQWWGLRGAAVGAPTLVVLPTITGYGDDLRGLVRELHAQLGWPVAVCNRRGHGPLPLTAPKVNTFGDTGDLRMQLAAIEARRPGAPLYAAGLSAGSGLLVRYLGEEREASRIRAAILHCPGYDIETVFERTHRFYDRLMTRRLIAHFLERHADVMGAVDGYQACASASTLTGFHDRLAPLAGYGSRRAYYEGSNPMVVADAIAVPMLVINAEDDPVCHIDNVREHGLPLLEVLPECALAITPRGSHCAFWEGLRGRRSWAERVMGEYLAGAHAVMGGRPPS